MVGIVVVSHSEALAEGVVALAREMGGAELSLQAAGGTGRDKSPSDILLTTWLKRSAGGSVCKGGVIDSTGSLRACWCRRH
jgi:hypothetical protein